MSNIYLWLGPGVVVSATSLIALVVVRNKSDEFEQYKQLHPEQSVKVARAPAVEKKLPKDIIEDDPALRAHWDAINRCKHEGNVPVMGYNYSVICLNKATVAWAQVDSIPF